MAPNEANYFEKTYTAAGAGEEPRVAFLVSLLVASMLRFRARSVYNGARRVPAGALECYTQALRRMPWLFVTELVRNAAMFFAGIFLLLPGIGILTPASSAQTAFEPLLLPPPHDVSMASRIAVTAITPITCLRRRQLNDPTRTAVIGAKKA